MRIQLLSEILVLHWSAFRTAQWHLKNLADKPSSLADCNLDGMQNYPKYFFETELRFFA